MPGVIPMRAIKVGSPESRIARACDNCRRKKIRCDGIKPCCTQCSNTGSECTVSDKLGSIVYPHGYTESLEERFRSLEAETRDLADTIDERDEAISNHAAAIHEVEITHEAIDAQEDPSQHQNLGSKLFTIARYELAFDQGLAEAEALKAPLALKDVYRWLQRNISTASGGVVTPATNLLIIKTPDVPTGGQEILPLRESYECLQASLGPCLRGLGIPPEVLSTFGSVVFDKFHSHAQLNETSDIGLNNTHSYFIAYGFFSLAWRYFPASQRCVGLLFQQGEDSRKITSSLLKEMSENHLLMSHQWLLPFSAHRAIGLELSCWMAQYKKEIVAAQSQTGYHHMLAIENYQGTVNFSELSSKISGIAINIATNHFCWQVLEDHVKFMIEETEILSQPLAIGDLKQAAASRHTTMSRARQLARHARFMLQETDVWQKRASIQIQGLFNLIAQCDQTTSVDIARDSRTLAQESKKDSDSMKTIAAVTMVFLPGTFVAVCNSLDLFGKSFGALLIIGYLNSRCSPCLYFNGTLAGERALLPTGSGYIGL